MKLVMNIFLIFVVILLCGFLYHVSSFQPERENVLSVQTQPSYWFMLARKSNREYLYLGVPGDVAQSKLMKTFMVKTGVPGQKPTPLPQLAGRDYWLIIDKMESFENPETAPYFLTLDIPVGDDVPYGPEPYIECDGQCNWELPGYFGLHGIAGDPRKLSPADPGSSGCIRHTDEDITFLYNLLDPEKSEIRYYIKDI